MHVALRQTETAHVAAVLSLLLSPPLSVVGAIWFNEIARALRELVGAQRAVFQLDTATGMQLYGDRIEQRVTRAYVRYYHALDLGMQRQRALGVEVWSRRQLWGQDELLRSEYYNDFARPNRLHDTVGLALSLPAAHVHAHVSLIHDEPVRSPQALVRQLALLTLVQPAFRVGVTTHVQRTCTDLTPRVDPRAPLLDATDEPQALYACDGRLLHRNPAMADALGEDRRRSGLHEAVGQAVRALLDAHRRDRERAERATTHVVRTSTASYRVRARLVRDGEDADGAVLVSLRRSEGTVPTVEELSARFGLTTREAQVAALLAERRSNAEIASALDLSEHTARHHTESVLQKLGVHSRAALAEALRRR